MLGSNKKGSSELRRDLRMMYVRRRTKVIHDAKNHCARDYRPLRSFNIESRHRSAVRKPPSEHPCVL